MTEEQDKAEKGKRRRKKSKKQKPLTAKDFAIVGIFGLVVLFILSIIGYFCMAWGAILLPVNSSYTAPTQGIIIYVQSNGFHTDLVIPIKNTETGTNWLTRIADSTIVKTYENYSYVSMGWGDDGFFMDSYDNNFPSTPTIFSALFIPSTTLMHVTFYPTPMAENEDVVKIIISPQQYKDLVHYIDQSFKKDIDNKYIPKNAKGYYKNDYFFHANGYYHLFRTCNDWTNTGLKAMGLKTSRKAPFASGVMYHIKK